MRFIVLLAVLALAGSPVLGPALAQVEFPDEGPEILPAGAHRGEVFARCTGCHSSAIIRRTRLDRARWDDLMDWMTEKHGMPALDDGERIRVVDYLAAAFPPNAGRARAVNPFSED